MARLRTIKPEFWTSEQVVECSPMARLLFVGLWNFCDDAGRHTASPRRLKMEVFPADDFSCEQIKEWMTELIEVGLVLAYVVDGQELWQVTGWHHQKVDKPTVRFPAPPEFDDCSSNARRSLPEASPPERNGTECSGTERSVAERSVKERSLNSGRAGVFTDVTKETLRDDQALLAWFEGAAERQRPVVARSEQDLLRVFGAAERSLLAKNPPAYFASIVGKGKWEAITQAQEDRAAQRIRELRNRGRPPAAEAQSLARSFAPPAD